MKILYGIENHFPGYGGPYTAVSQTAYNLYLHDINVKLIYAKNENYKYNLDLKTIIEDYDICHFFGIWTPWYYKAFNIAKKLNKKIIISPLGALEPWAMSQKKYKKLLAWHFYQKKILNNSTYIHATSVDEKEHLIELGVNTPIKVLSHGIEISKIKLIKHEIKPNKKAIFFSRIHEKKGLLELIESWKKINHPDWHLDIYGPVTDFLYLKKIKEKIKELDLSQKINLFSPIYTPEEKKNLYMSSDCFILPSKSENFGMSIGESLSFGVPVITTTQTPWKIIERYNAGMIFDFSQENLTKTLKKFFSLTSSELESMRLNSKKLIDENYDFKTIIPEYIKFYKSLIK
tara:strand:- start:1172 stop:2209 length:1038 start_codon:yes stop_codon:yes gene_type:complete